MSTSNTLETGILKLLFQNVNFAGLGDFGGLSGSQTASGSVFLTLHTSDPGEAGDQTTNEANYTGYARLPINRNTSEWSESGGVITNINDQLFAPCTAGSNTITHFGIGTALTGAGKLLYSNTLTNQLTVSTGVTPRVLASALTVTQT
jgi:hypothetical protein